MKSFKGDLGFEDIKKHQFQRLFEDWGSDCIGIEELRYFQGILVVKL